jgi:hypothetical protein
LPVARSAPNSRGEHKRLAKAESLRASPHSRPARRSGHPIRAGHRNTKETRRPGWAGPRRAQSRITLWQALARNRQSSMVRRTGTFGPPWATDSAGRFPSAAPMDCRSKPGKLQVGAVEQLSVRRVGRRRARDRVWFRRWSAGRFGRAPTAAALVPRPGPFAPSASACGRSRRHPVGRGGGGAPDQVLGQVRLMRASDGDE